jgi:hypothetical protein
LSRETNKVKCKKYREKEKQNKKDLANELERGMEKYRVLVVKANILEQKVNKLKNIVRKLARNQNVDISIRYV